ADLQSIAERFGRLEGLKLAYVGDGNNVAHSLMMACARVGMHFACAAPAGYAMDAAWVARARAIAAEDGGGSVITETTSPAEAAAGAHVLYTDVWASMGQEEEQQKRLRDFVGFQVDAALMAQA